MPRKRTVKLRCPICKKSVKSTDPDFPFCSDRCRIIDLGKWASDAYVISSPTTDAASRRLSREPALSLPKGPALRLPTGRPAHARRYGQRSSPPSSESGA